MNWKGKIQTVPISILISVSLIVIFLLYTTTLIKTVPCGKNVLETFSRNFIHVEFYHLLSNMFALYGLSRIEEKIGLKRFLLLITFLLLFNTVIETILAKTFENFKCSIGFSGVLFGVITWELIMTKTVDIFLLFSVALLIVYPSLKNQNVSLVGHSVGAFSGIIGGFIWKKIAGNKELFKKN